MEIKMGVLQGHCSMKGLGFVGDLNVHGQSWAHLCDFRFPVKLPNLLEVTNGCKRRGEAWNCFPATKIFSMN